MTNGSSTGFRLEQRFQSRLYFLTVTLFIIAVVFLLQLFNLQILQGRDNRLLAKKFVSRQEFKVAPRGFIFDRNLNVDDPLVYNINYIDYAIFPARFPNRKAALDYLQNFARLMGRPFSEFEPIIEPDNWKRLTRRNEKVILIHRVSREEQERLASFQLDLRYGSFETEYLRYYRMGPAMAHVSGYTGLPSRRELEQKLALPYQILGKDGLEAFYDSELRGRDGVVIQNKIFDSRERLSRSRQGNHIVLNIDQNVQAAAYRSLVNSGKRGTVVAMKAETGEILALVSTPAFDPNILSSVEGSRRNTHYEEVSRHRGFLNLAIQARFPPASTFKPLVALAALERGNPLEINRDLKFTCPGSWKLKSSMESVPDSVFYCHNKAGHGTLDMVHAIAESCNVYFYNLGYKIGPSPIIDYSRMFGLDRETGIDLPGEQKGFVPDQRWKQIRWSSRWYDGDTVNTAIGQGFLEVTPMELAVLYAALANNGKIVKPHLLREVRDPETGRLLRRIDPQIVQTLNLSREHLRTVQEGLRAVVHTGTGRYLNQKGLVPAAGKTGTVQTRSGRKGVDHAWFAGYAPFDDMHAKDRVVVVVFVEHGRAGSASAVPIAADVWKAAFPGWKEKPAALPANPMNPTGATTVSPTAADPLLPPTE